jgi:hypothetical protein
VWKEQNSERIVIETRSTLDRWSLPLVDVPKLLESSDRFVVAAPDNDANSLMVDLRPSSLCPHLA